MFVLATLQFYNVKIILQGMINTDKLPCYVNDTIARFTLRFEKNIRFQDIKYRNGYHIVRLNRQH